MSFKVDWSLAPEWAEIWVITECGQAWWGAGNLDTWRTNNRGGWSSTGSGVKTAKAPTYNYEGDWKESLTLRPLEEITKKLQADFTDILSSARNEAVIKGSSFLQINYNALTQEFEYEQFHPENIVIKI